MRFVSEIGMDRADNENTDKSSIYGQFIQISAFLRLGSGSYSLPQVSNQTAHDLMIKLLGLNFDANVRTFLLSASVSCDFFHAWRCLNSVFTLTL